MAIRRTANQLLSRATAAGSRASTRSLSTTPAPAVTVLSVPNEQRISFGDGKQPTPYDLLMASLGSCTSNALLGHAQQENLLLEGVEVALDHATMRAERTDVEASTTFECFTRDITVHGERLTADDREGLLRVANSCPVYTTLASSSVVSIESTLVPATT